MPPTQAKDVAEAIAKHAHHAQTGNSQLSRQILGNRLKEKLLNRFTLALVKDMESGKKPTYIAAKLLDICLSEVL